MRSIYFDANIYSYASRDAQVDHLRSWLDRKGWSAVASILNLIELARTGDRAQALAFVGALTRITRNHEDPPFTVLLADEFLEEVKRHRPNWGRACGWKGRAERLVSYRKTWNAVRASPEEALVRLTDFRGHHAPLEQGLHEQQAQVAEWLRDRGVTAVEVVVSSTLRRLVGDQLADRVDRLPAAERFVRLSALEDWVAALLANGSAPNDLRDWVDGHLNSVDEPALAEFWLSDVRLDVVAHHAIRGLVRHLQPRRSVKQSNRNDVDQANWLLRAELVLTADKRFFDLLLQAREHLCAWAHSIHVAQLGLVAPGPDILDAIEKAVAGAK